MNWKHILYIIPLCLILGYLIGIASHFYINIPEKIELTMGMSEKTLDALESKCFPIQDLPQPEMLNVTLKDIDGTISNIYTARG